MRFPAQSAITDQTDDTTKRFFLVFKNNFGHCSQAEDTLKLNPSDTPVFRPKRPEQPWFRIHEDFAGPINGLSFFRSGRHPFQMSRNFLSAECTCSTTAILKRLFSQRCLSETLVSDNGSEFTSETFHHFAVHAASRMFGHHPPTYNPTVKQNVLWIPLNVIYLKQRGREQREKR